MKIKYQGHKARTQKAIPLWVAIATDYNAGIGVTELRNSGKYINPKTGKPYSRAFFYWVFNKLKTTAIKDL
jgi:mannose/cellobiose epimerase-like protein (N-acyl-D-glucosamine 2-epimerase family)